MSASILRAVPNRSDIRPSIDEDATATPYLQPQHTQTIVVLPALHALPSSHDSTDETLGDPTGIAGMWYERIDDRRVGTPNLNICDPFRPADAPIPIHADARYASAAGASCGLNSSLRDVTDRVSFRCSLEDGKYGHLRVKPFSGHLDVCGRSGHVNELSQGYINDAALHAMHHWDPTGCSAMQLSDVYCKVLSTNDAHLGHVFSRQMLV